MFLWLLIPFILGILVAHYLPYFGIFKIVKVTLCVLFVLFLWVVLNGKASYSFQIKLINGSLVQLFFLLLGMWTWYFHRDELKAYYFGKYQADFFVGTVCTDPQLKYGAIDVVLEVNELWRGKEKHNVCGRLRQKIYLNDSINTTIKYGTQLKISAYQIKPIAIKLNPYTFDYQKYMYEQGVLFENSVSLSEVKILSQNKGNFLKQKAIECRQYCMNRYRQILTDSVAIGIANALILGEKSSLDEETQQDFRRTGTIHALVISGMHVAYLYVFLISFLKHLPNRKHIHICKIVGIIAILFMYSLFTGFSASVIRSFIMISIYLIAKEVNSKPHSYHIWAMSAFVMLLFSPDWMFQLGFLLSFLAVFGILFTHQPLSRFLQYKWIPKSVTEAVSVCVSAQIFVLPFMVYYFHSFPLNFILSNLWITLPIVILMVLGPIILLIPLRFLSMLFEWIVSIMTHVLHDMSNINFLIINNIYFNLTAIFSLFFTVLFFVMMLKYQKKQFLLSFVLSVGFLVAAIQWQKLQSNRQNFMAIFSLKNDYAVAFVQGKETVLLTSLQQDDKQMAYQVLPLINKSASKIISYDTLGTNLKFKNLLIKGDTLVFNQKKFKILLRQSQEIEALDVGFEGVFYFRYPVYYRFPVFSPSQKVFLLGGNYAYQSENYIEYFKKNHINYFDMRKNNAYLEYVKHRHE